MHMLEIRNISKHYAYKKYLWQRKKKLPAVEEVNLSIAEGVCLGLVGESGCGKTTLGRVVSGLEKPNKGEVVFQGKNAYEGDKADRLHLRRNLQMVFQDCPGSVNPKMTAGDIIGEPLENFMKTGEGERKESVEKLLETVGLNREDYGKYPSQFSGGQLQRVCIARAVSVKPKLIVLDEPLSSLDVSVQAQILNLLADLKREYGLSYLFISHDMESVYYLSDALAVMYLGSIVEYIEDISLFDRLCHPYTKTLISSVLTSRPEKLRNTGEGAVGGKRVESEGSGCKFAPRCTEAKDKCSSERPLLTKISEKHYRACHQN